MRRAVFPIVLSIILLGLGGCRDVPKDKYVELSGRVFIFNYRIATATYVVTLRKLQPLPANAVATAVFDNPAGGDKLIVSQKVWPQLDKITLESQPLNCVVKDKSYAFTVTINDENGKIIQEFTSSITSTLDQSILPDRPLVIGHLYTPNPELVGHPDGKIPGLVKPACPH